MRWKGLDVRLKLGKGVGYLAFFRVRTLIPSPRRATVSSWTVWAPGWEARAGLGMKAVTGFPGFADKGLRAREGGWHLCGTLTREWVLRSGILGLAQHPRGQLSRSGVLCVSVHTELAKCSSIKPATLLVTLPPDVHPNQQLLRVPFPHILAGTRYYLSW